MMREGRFEQLALLLTRSEVMPADHHHHQIIKGKNERRTIGEEKEGRKGKKVETGKKP